MWHPLPFLFVGAARDSSDDFGVELSWPEDEVAGRLRPARAATATPIDAPSREQRAELVRRRPLELQAGVPRDTGRALEMLSERIDGLADAVRSLQHALAGRLEDHRAQLISLRRRVARLDSMDDVAAEFLRKRDELFQALADRSARQDKLQEQLLGLS